MSIIYKRLVHSFIPFRNLSLSRIVLSDTNEVWSVLRNRYYCCKPILGKVTHSDRNVTNVPTFLLFTNDSFPHIFRLLSYPSHLDDFSIAQSFKLSPNRQGCSEAAETNAYQSCVIQQCKKSNRNIYKVMCTNEPVTTSLAYSTIPSIRADEQKWVCQESCPQIILQC